MYLKIYLFAILVFFILAFAVRNVKTFLNTGKSIKGQSKKLTASIVLSTLIYAALILRILLWSKASFAEIDLPKYFQSIGILLVSIGFIIGILALKAMKNSWRVGIKYEQKTELVTSGIYRFSRNPYFLSYNILIFGFILIYPSWMLIIPYIFLVIVFHKMILEEEAYLLSVHRDSYKDYSKNVGRYFTLT